MHAQYLCILFLLIIRPAWYTDKTLNKAHMTFARPRMLIYVRIVRQCDNSFLHFIMCLYKKY